MATTAQNVIDLAGGLLEILNNPGDSVGTNESADMLKVLQHLIAEWTEDGGLNIPVPAATSTTLNISPGTVRGLAYNLAVDYGPWVGGVSQIVASIAADTRDRILGKTTVSRELDFMQDGLIQNRNYFNIDHG